MPIQRQNQFLQGLPETGSLKSFIIAPKLGCVTCILDEEVHKISCKSAFLNESLFDHLEYFTTVINKNSIDRRHLNSDEHLNPVL